VGESDVFLDGEGKRKWMRREEALKREIRRRIRVFTPQNMSQEELRALVPSLQEQHLPHPAG
jgi:hypothetical protein